MLGEERIFINMTNIAKTLFFTTDLQNKLCSASLQCSTSPVWYCRQLTWNHLQQFMGKHERMDILLS